LAEVLITESKDVASEIVAEKVLALIRRKPDAAIGLATGSSPLAIYRSLASQLASHEVDVSRVRGFALDEYVGLPPGHPESYRSVINREVVEPLGLTPELVSVPDGSLEGIALAGDRYEHALIAAGGVDIQILGIGTDGHIGFNEPGSSLASLTRVKTLTLQTRRDNARFFGTVAEVPLHCITQGLGTILRARHLVLVAFGEGKASALAGAVEGPVSSSNPGSAIQLHPHVTVLADEAAASGLANNEHYRFAWANKPAWQGI
jgi:glucosamine-6-phosphate deaminase